MNCIYVMFVQLNRKTKLLSGTFIKLLLYVLIKACVLTSLYKIFIMEKKFSKLTGFIFVFRIFLHEAFEFIVCIRNDMSVICVK